MYILLFIVIAIVILLIIFKPKMGYQTQDWCFEDCTDDQGTCKNGGCDYNSGQDCVPCSSIDGPPCGQGTQCFV